MKIGYVRVSTKEQNEARQLDLLRKQGIEEFNIYVDKISGSEEHRPALDKMLSILCDGDILVVSSFDRLARSTSQLLELSETLNRKGVNLISLKEQIDTSTPQGKLFFTISAAFSEFERELIKERQQEGIRSAKERGVKLGRNPIDSTKLNAALDMYQTGNYTVKQVCSMVGISESVFYRFKRKQRA